LFNGISLYEEYLKKNLVLDGSYKGKPFNSKASSSYHIWQSKQRFTGGITDIDLLRLDNKNNPIELFEIKRSKIAIDSWKPYYNDRGGYEILSTFCKIENLDFSIVYYHYSTEELIEDITKLMVMRKLEGFNFKKLGTYNLKEFIDGIYSI
jgi:DNA-directed RNA polymerase alpha subunit